MTWLPVDENGVVDPQTLRDELSVHADEVALVTVMWANNEVGSIMPIVELAEISAEFEIPMHSDAVQAVAQLPVDFAASKLAALSIAAHKFGVRTASARFCSDARFPVCRSFTAADTNVICVRGRRTPRELSGWLRRCARMSRTSIRAQGNWRSCVTV